MKRNAVIPYAIIALVGIVMVIVISVAVVNQRDAIQKKAEGSEVTDQAQEGEVTQTPKEMFASSCASCHGDDLSGNFGPPLKKIGSQLSKEEIHDIIKNGKGDHMPGGLLKREAEIEAVAGWLSEHK